MGILPQKPSPEASHHVQLCTKPADPTRKGGAEVRQEVRSGLPSMKRADFVDGSGILNFPSMKRADFVDGSWILNFPSMKKAVFVDGKSE